jgi:hypothetical protein
MVRASISMERMGRPSHAPWAPSGAASPIAAASAAPVAAPRGVRW